MIRLFLSEPTWNNDGDDQSSEHTISLLNKLESVIRSLMSSEGRSEARLWLCNTISGITCITPRHQRDLFVSLLRCKPLKQDLAAQLLHMIFEKQPSKAGSIIAKKSYKLDSFFKGNPRRILQWFSNFSNSGDLKHGKGARALSQYAFVNRDVCWEELEWRGKHGQSPAMVATNPHYFLDLDVQGTIENFLEYVPEFWSSDEFAESLKDGEILFMDTNFFVSLFVDLMYKEDSNDVWDVINEFLLEESFSSLCRRLLIILDERDLSIFLESIRKFLNPNVENTNSGSPYWLEILLSKCINSGSIDELLLLNAVISHGRQLLRLLREEENKGEEVKIKDILVHISKSLSQESAWDHMMQECVKARTLESIKWFGLYSWALHYNLTVEYQTRESWESLFISNKIDFRKSKNYDLLHHNGLLEESGSDLDETGSKRVKRKKKEKRRTRRRRKIDHDDSNDGLLDYDFSNNALSLQSKLGCWFLSTDEYSIAWSSVDLPEHLSKHCFCTWMKWVLAKWKAFA